MSFTTEQVRAQLAAMGHSDVPDAAVALFAARLTDRAEQRRQQAEADEREEKSEPSVQVDDSDDSETMQPHARRIQTSNQPYPRHVHSHSARPTSFASRPPLPPSNRSIIQQRRPREPLTPLPHSASPRQPLRVTHTRSPAHNPPTPPSRAEEQCDDDDNDQAIAAGTQPAVRGRSDKENVATLINIQRGLAKVLAERGIASPLKPPTSPLSSHHSTTADSYRPTSPTGSSCAASSSSMSDVSFTSGSSTVTVSVFSGTPSIGVRAMQLREEERVRGVRRGYGQGGFKKADIVNRYQQYKAKWEQSSFLHRRQQGK